MSNHFRFKNLVHFLPKNLHILGWFWSKTDFETILAFFRMRWFWKIKNFKHHKNVSNHILFYVFIISQHFTGGHSIIKIKYFWDFVILHFYRIFNRIDQSESTAKILDLVQVDHWTDHKTNIVAASFQGLLKKTGAKHFQIFWWFGAGIGGWFGRIKGAKEYNLT